MPFGNTGKFSILRSPDKPGWKKPQNPLVQPPAQSYWVRPGCSWVYPVLFENLQGQRLHNI